MHALECDRDALAELTIWRLVLRRALEDFLLADPVVTRRRTAERDRACRLGSDVEHHIVAMTRSPLDLDWGVRGDIGKPETATIDTGHRLEHRLQTPIVAGHPLWQDATACQKHIGYENGPTPRHHMGSDLKRGERKKRTTRVGPRPDWPTNCLSSGPQRARACLTLLTGTYESACGPGAASASVTRAAYVRAVLFVRTERPDV